MNRFKTDGSQESFSFWNDERESLSLYSEYNDKVNYEEITSKLLKMLRKEHIENNLLKRMLRKSNNQVEFMLKYVADKSSNISGISNILFLEKDNICMLWFIAKELNEELEDAIYSLEFDLMSNFDKLNFDFLLLPEKGKTTFPDKVIEIL